MEAVDGAKESPDGKDMYGLGGLSLVDRAVRNEAGPLGWEGCCRGVNEWKKVGQEFLLLLLALLDVGEKFLGNGGWWCRDRLIGGWDRCSRWGVDRGWRLRHWGDGIGN